MFRSFDYQSLVLVLVGGSIGVFARAGIMTFISTSETTAWVTLAINGTGSLLLGIMVGTLTPQRTRLRAFLGIGLLGGFTTYSAFAVETAAFLTSPLAAGVLVLGSLLAGVMGAITGVFLGCRMLTSRRDRA